MKQALFHILIGENIVLNIEDIKMYNPFYIAGFQLHNKKFELILRYLFFGICYLCGNCFYEFKDFK